MDDKPITLNPDAFMGPDYSREGIFVYHNCYKCQHGAKPCVNGAPNQCDYPRARND